MKCKLERCNNEIEQSGRGAPRKFCCDEHRVEYWNAHLRPPPQVRHSITNVDEEKRTGDCAKCGSRVKVFRIEDTYADGRPRVRWVCSNRVATAPSRHRYNRSDKRKAATRRSRYRLTAEELAVYMSKQTGRCDICGGEPKRLVLDHCHVVGGFRGWLCDPCNLMLGNAKDSPETLRAAAVYLEQYAVRQHGESHGKE